MGRTGIGLVVLGAALLIVCGCKHDDNLKPPKEDPVYRLPPNDQRYTSYPNFPQNTLNQFPKRDVPGADEGFSKGPQRMGMGGPGQ